MFCKNCGSPLDPQYNVCMRCGVQKGAGFNFCGNCGRPMAPGSMSCTSCGAGAIGNVGVERKSRLVATLLCFFLGGFGIHDFYLGYTRNGILKILLTCCTGIGGGLWALIDFIRLLTGGLHTDGKGNELKKDY